jgi:hypothetical protein
MSAVSRPPAMRFRALRQGKVGEIFPWITTRCCPEWLSTTPVLKPNPERIAT